MNILIRQGNNVVWVRSEGSELEPPPQYISHHSQIWINSQKVIFWFTIFIFAVGWQSQLVSQLNGEMGFGTLMVRTMDHAEFGDIQAVDCSTFQQKGHFFSLMVFFVCENKYLQNWHFHYPLLYFC